MWKLRGMVQEVTLTRNMQMFIRTFLCEDQKFPLFSFVVFLFWNILDFQILFCQLLFGLQCLEHRRLKMGLDK